METRKILRITHGDDDKINTEKGIKCCVRVKNKSHKTVETKLKVKRLETIPYDPVRQERANRFVGTFLTPLDAEVENRMHEEIATFSLEDHDDEKRVEVVHFRSASNEVYLLITKGGIRRGKWHRDNAELLRGKYRIVLEARVRGGGYGRQTFIFEWRDDGVVSFCEDGVGSGVGE